MIITENFDGEVRFRNNIGFCLKMYDDEKETNMGRM